MGVEFLGDGFAGGLKCLTSAFIDNFYMHREQRNLDLTFMIHIKIRKKGL